MDLVINDEIDDKLFEMLKNEMNSEEQELFIQSFKTYLKYGNDDKAFVINLDNVWQWMGFDQKQHANRLLTKHFNENTHYIVAPSTSGQRKNEGGFNKKTTMMTVNTFKKFCMKTNNKKSEQICDYYLKMENIMHKYTQQKLIDTEKNIQEKELEFMEKIELTRHNTLIEHNRHISGVYIGKVKTLDNGYIILKFGSTQDIKTRTTSHIKTFGQFILLDFFPSTRQSAFEHSLMKHPTISKYKYNEPINDINSTELFCIDPSQYEEILSIVTLKRKEFCQDQLEYEDKFRQIEHNRKMEQLSKEIELEQLKQKNNNSEVITKEIIKEVIIEPQYSYEILDRNITRGNKVQKYSLDGKLIATYNGVRETTRKEEGTSDTAIKDAIMTNSIYRDHRWLYLERDKPDDTIQEIGEHNNRSQQHREFIAMLDINKEYIVKVFSNQKEAGINRHLSISGISSAIKRKTLSSGHYFCYYSECSDELKNNYLEHSTLPKPIVKSNAIPVKQISPTTNEVIKIYNSICDVQKEFQASRITLKKVLNNNIIYKGYRWSL